MPRCLTIPVLVGVLTLGPAVGCLAGQRPVPQAGDSVRFRPAGAPHAWVSGQVVETNDSGMTVRRSEADRPGESERFSWSEVTRLAVARGAESNAYRGALIGAALGGGIGALVGGTSGAVLRIDCESNCDPGLEDAFLGGLVVGTAGALIGRLIGGRMTSIRWVDADPGPRR